jgi:hypothetical protein
VEEIVYKVYPLPEDARRMYGFANFTLNLNYIDDEMRKSLPPSDCRFRPDSRWMEEGDLDKATIEKHRLEEK